jgi:hypothetical protein
LGYVLEALLAPPPVAETAAASLSGTSVVTLHERIALVPITENAAEALSPGDRSIISLLTRHPLPAALTELLRRTSREGPIAYVEADFFGGTGQQAAVLWEHGEIALGPLVDPEPTMLLRHRRLFRRRRLSDRPFNQVLRAMGVSVAPGQLDEFDTVGLGRHRDTDDWLGDDWLGGATRPDPRSA